MSTLPLWGDVEKHYVASVTQTSTDAPVASIVSNTLGGIPVWARSSAGVYTLTLLAAFVAGKTSFQVVNSDQNVVGIARTSESVLTITAGDDGVLDCSIRVQVWN